jgi:hypothetical protein
MSTSTPSTNNPTVLANQSALLDQNALSDQSLHFEKSSGQTQPSPKESPIRLAGRKGLPGGTRSEAEMRPDSKKESTSKAKRAATKQPAASSNPATTSKVTKQKTPAKGLSKSPVARVKPAAKSTSKRRKTPSVVSEAELLDIVFARTFESGPQSSTAKRRRAEVSEAKCPVENFADLVEFLPTVWAHSAPFDVWEPIVVQPSSPTSNVKSPDSGQLLKSPKQVFVRLGGRDVVDGVSLYHSSASDFAPLVKRAVFVAVVGWATKVCAMLYVNKQTGGVIELRTWRFGIRYLAFNTSPANFTRITSSSTVALSFVMLALVLAGMLRNSRAVNVGGWMFAPVTLANSIVVDLIMQKNFAPYTDLQRMRWAFGSAALCSVLIVVWIAIEHPHERFVAFTERLKSESSALVRPNLRGVAAV